MSPKAPSWICVILALAMPVAAAELDESAAKIWQIDGADCNYLVLAHRGDPEEASEPGAEYLRLRAGAGTYIYAGRPAEPARLIEDLTVTVPVRSNQRGLQVFGRVVFPDTIDPKTGRRATLLIAGESYQRVGRWQRLQIREIPLKFERQVRLLRARLRQPVDTRSAYFESVIVNVFGGPGTTDVWLGQIEQTGVVSPPESVVATVGFDAPEMAAMKPPRRQATRLIVDGRPFFPRVIEYRGEPLSLLRDLGFNTVAFNQSVTPAQHRTAAELGLWLVAPPHSDETTDDARILGWFCGHDLPLARLSPDYLDRIRSSDPQRRPLIAAVARHQWQASRELDILLHERDPLGSSFQLAHYGPWLDQRTQLARPGTPFWSTVQSELSPEFVQQIRSLVQVDGPLPNVVQVEQIRQQALAGVAAGARGLWFRSLTPLDASDPNTQLRRLMLELINYELALVAPWGMGGHRIGEVPCDNAELRVVALATERSRLLIPTYVQADAQFACRPTNGDSKLVIAGVADSTDVFQLSHVGLLPLKKQRISGGLRFELSAKMADSLLLLTEDPLVVTHINRTVAASKRRVIELELELAERLLSDFETTASRKLLSKTERIETWETARQALRTSRDLAEAKDYSSAYQFARQANRELNQLQYDVWREMTRHLDSPISHPAGASFHLAAASNLAPDTSSARSQWSTHRLRGGDCENLDVMIDAGWRQHQSSPKDVGTYIALSPHDPHGGQTSLRIMASAKTPDADQSAVEYPPVWINTAPITVEPGQRVRISGWIRIDEPIRGGFDGCMIGDSLSGPGLALRYRRTDGWERFEMIRAITRRDHVSVVFTLQGLGEVWLDDIDIALATDAAAQVSRK